VKPFLEPVIHSIVKPSTALPIRSGDTGHAHRNEIEMIELLHSLCSVCLVNHSNLPVGEQLGCYSCPVLVYQSVRRRHSVGVQKMSLVKIGGLAPERSPDLHSVRTSVVHSSGRGSHHVAFAIIHITEVSAVSDSLLFDRDGRHMCPNHQQASGAKHFAALLLDFEWAKCKGSQKEP
jgi:hypothetical protein